MNKNINYYFFDRVKCFVSHDSKHIWIAWFDQLKQFSKHFTKCRWKNEWRDKTLGFILNTKEDVTLACPGSRQRDD